MTGARAFLQNRRVNPLAIVTDPQPEQIRVVLDCSFDPACASVLECVSQDLATNPVDLVLEQRRQGSWLPFLAAAACADFVVPALIRCSIRPRPTRTVSRASNQIVAGPIRVLATPLKVVHAAFTIESTRDTTK
jgi:hypothetical protein